ncbi:MAG: phosphoglycerate kinase [Planctomycetota bacterium]|nr:MAG: phosphoglycerate kinase [Planctomycetota bacterium]
MATKTIADIDLAGKSVLMRVDFNVPLKDGKITNDKRIVAALPSINKVIEAGGKLVLMSHLGRPKGQVKSEFSLAPAAARLGELLGKEVKLGPADVAGPEARELAGALQPGQVLVLENVRFDSREDTKDDIELVKQFGAELAELGEVYVNDAFGTCHRKHASMWACPLAVQAKGGPAVAGCLVEKEIKYLNEAVANPAKPFLAILGGAKVSDKIKLISMLLGKVDKIIIGGAMAYTLLKAKGVEVGSSRVEEDQLEQMAGLLAEAGDKIVLPSDHLVAEEFASDAAKPTDGVGIPAGMMGLDIGPKTVKLFSRIVRESKTIIWNGPMGVFEREAYAAGTQGVAQAMADATASGAISVIGGGDSATAVEDFGLAEKMTHVSTGGGASLTYLEGKPMPPIEVLDQK